MPARSLPTRSLTTLLLMLVALTLFAGPAAAEDGLIGPSNGGFDLVNDLAKPAVLCVVFTIIGLILFAACIWITVRVTPFSVRKEIEEDQNVALGIIIGSMILGIAIILAAALLG